MSKAYECDRCGKLEPGKPPNILKTDNTKDGVPLIGEPYLTKESHEFCMECAEKFRKFLKQPE
jgi:hypothetical protein